jgi:hypothetical protein
LVGVSRYLDDKNKKMGLDETIIKIKIDEALNAAHMFERILIPLVKGKKFKD